MDLAAKAAVLRRQWIILRTSAITGGAAAKFVTSFNELTNSCTCTLEPHILYTVMYSGYRSSRSCSDNYRDVDPSL